MEENKIRAIMIEDEERARMVLRQLLTDYCPRVELMAEAGDVPTGVQAIQHHQPDVVFLDISLPGYTGFQLLDFFQPDSFAIIFTTAYREHAVRAFEVSAVDYLLKPIEIDALIQSMEKLERRLHGGPRLEEFTTLRQNLAHGMVTRIALPVHDGILFVDAEEMLHLEADGAYTRVALADGSRILVAKNLKTMERLLDHPAFFRTHRSHLINLKRVRKFVRNEGGFIEMDNGDVVSLAKDRRELFLQVFTRL